MPGIEPGDAGMGRDSLLRPLLAAVASAAAVLLLAAAASPGAASGDPGGKGAALLVRVFPWARVRVDGGPWRLTPLAAPIPVSPGDHVVVAEHPVLGRVERAVAVAPGTTLGLVLSLPVRDARTAGDPIPSTAPAGAGPPAPAGPAAPRSPRARSVPPPRGPAVLPGAPRPATFLGRQLLARRRAGRPEACARLARRILARGELSPGTRHAAVRHGGWALLALGREREAAALLDREVRREEELAPDPALDPPALVALWPTGRASGAAR